jgi:hypothetical protein
MVEQDDGFLPSRAERRDTLQRLIKKARGCAKALRAFKDANTGTDHEGNRKHNPPDALLIQELPDLPELLEINMLEIRADEVETWANNADAVLRSLPKRGAEEKRARHQLIRDLADIFHAIGKQPTRRHNAMTGKDYGPFRDFVHLVLQSIDPNALRGSDHDIRAVAGGTATALPLTDPNRLLRYLQIHFERGEKTR